MTFTITFRIILGVIGSTALCFAAVGFWMLTMWSDSHYWRVRAVAVLLLAAAVGVAWWGWT